MAAVRLEFAQFGHFDYFKIYRNLASTNIEDLGQPIGTSSTMYYEDSTVEPNLSYFYRIGVVRDSVEEFSDEIIVVASQFTTVALLKFDGNLNDETGKFYASVGTTSFGSDINGQYAIFSGNYIYTNHSSDFDFTNDFRVEVHAKFLSLPSNAACSFIGTYLNNDGWVLQFRNDEGKGNRLRFSIGDTIYADFAFTPTLNQLYRFKVERLDGYIVCKVDDVQVGSSVYLPNNIEANVSSTLNIGVLKYNSSVIQVFNGYIYNIQIDKRIN